MGYQDPRLIHPVKVKVSVRRQDQTLWDEDAREPIGNVVSDLAVELPGQVSWKSREVDVGSEGISERFDGYVLFLRKDLAKARIDISEGDRILSIGEGDARVDVSLWIWRLQYRGHYQKQGGWTMLKAWFKDKRPVV